MFGMVGVQVHRIVCAAKHDREEAKHNKRGFKCAMKWNKRKERRKGKNGQQRIVEEANRENLYDMCVCVCLLRQTAASIVRLFVRVPTNQWA